MKKRVLLLITNLDFGGAQRVFHDLSLLLAQKHDVVECVFNNYTGNAFPTGNRVVSLDVRAGSNLVDKLFCLLLRVQRLRKIKRDLGIDVCISHLEGADLVNVLSSGSDRTITWIHGSKRHDENISGILGILRHRFLIPFIYRTATRVITVSRAISDELQTHYTVPQSKVRVSHNYFDVQSLAAMGREPIMKEFASIFNKQVLIFSGRLVEQKNPAALLEWFANFSRRDSVALVILGDGEQREELISLSVALGLRTYHPWADLELTDQHQVYFLGFQSNPHSFVARAYLLLLTSRWEGFPMVIGEALACGVPVVSTDCPTGPLEMLTELRDSPSSYPLFGEHGVLLPELRSSSHELWSNTVSSLLDNRKLRDDYALRGPGRAAEFSLERNASRIYELVDI